MKSGKALGSDGITPEVLKVIASSCPWILLNTYNSYLREVYFTKQWKLHRLVLVNKGKGDLGTPSVYRPFCMLDTAGKVTKAMSVSNHSQCRRPVKQTVWLSERLINSWSSGEVVRTFHTLQQGNHEYSQEV